MYWWDCMIWLGLSLLYTKKWLIKSDHCLVRDLTGNSLSLSTRYAIYAPSNIEHIVTGFWGKTVFVRKFKYRITNPICRDVNVWYIARFCFIWFLFCMDNKLAAEKLEDTKGVIKRPRSKTNNTMTKKKRAKWQALVYETIYNK